MTPEGYEQKRISIINEIIDTTTEASIVWQYHPENPKRIDPVSTHWLLVQRIKELEEQLLEYGTL
jgi:hypothetical protein